MHGKKGEIGSMKKIMIIGAGLLQSYVIKRAKELGYITVCVDGNQMQ